MKKSITPCFWMDGQGREASEFYCGLFPNSEIVQDSGIVVNFRLNGQDFLILNGGPKFKLDEAISLTVYCENQEEIDYYYGALAKEGEEQMCGWVKDKFGLCWQIVPEVLPKLMADPEKAGKVVEVFMKMKKFNIAELEAAGR